MADQDDSWKNAIFRTQLLSQIEEALQKCPIATNKNSAELENTLFQKAKTKEEYLGYVARLLLHLSPSNRGQNTQLAAALGNQNASMQSVVPNSSSQQPLLTSQIAQQEQQHRLISTNTLIQSAVPNQAALNFQQHQQTPGVFLQQHAVLQNQRGDFQKLASPKIRNQISRNMQSTSSPSMLLSGQLPANRNLQPNKLTPHAYYGNLMYPAPNMMSDLFQYSFPCNQVARNSSNYATFDNHLNQLPETGQIQLSESHLAPHNSGTYNISAHQLSQSAAVSSNSLPKQGNPAQFLVQSPNANVVSSPSSSIMTPGQTTPSPVRITSPASHMLPSPGSIIKSTQNLQMGNKQEDQIYMEKIQHLRKYVEPLRRMIAKHESEGYTYYVYFVDILLNVGDVEKNTKMQKLLDILMNPSSRVPMETLLKCEQVLERWDLKEKSKPEKTAFPPPSSGRDQNSFQILLDTVAAYNKSPMLSHTLQRTFTPVVDAIYGSEYWPEKKRQRKEKDVIVYEAADILEGEIARLDSKFTVSLNPFVHVQSKDIHLICQLDDQDLPSVPPISVIIPYEYPSKSPLCSFDQGEYTFFSNIRKRLELQMEKMPTIYSLTFLLNIWEMAVRCACNPNFTDVYCT